MRALPSRAALDLPAGPVPESQRAAVTAPALRATIEEWLAEPQSDGTRTLGELAATAHVPLDAVRALAQRGTLGVVPAARAARLLWVMGEPLRADLRLALADDLAAEASRRDGTAAAA